MTEEMLRPTACARWLQARGRIVQPRELVELVKRGKVPCERTGDGLPLLDPAKVLAALEQDAERS